MRTILESVRNQYSTTHHNNNTQHLTHLRSDRKFFNSIAADIAADRKFSGRFDLSKKNLCTDCNEYRSVSGACSC